MFYENIYKRSIRLLFMVLRLINAHACSPGTTIMVDGEACTVRSNDISKTGKHGASKCRMECIEILSGKKKIVGAPGDTRFDVPLIEKRKGQVLNASDDRASVMDLESYETIDIAFVEDLKGKLSPDMQVEYWDIEGKKCIMRII